jgi:hypothetical protein
VRETPGDRIVSVLRCPKDGRAMARVLATSRGRVLETIDAPVAYGGEVNRATAKLAASRFADAAQLFKGRRMGILGRRYPIALAAPDPSDFDAAIEAGEVLRPGVGRSVACPHCHTQRRVVIDPSGNAVLM